MEGDCSEEKYRKPKRRQRNPAEWRGEKRKRLILAGESHVSVKGLVMPPKKIGKDCECKLKCYEKVPEPTRELLFKGFYSLKTHDEQNAYLFGLIRKFDIKRKRNLQSDRRKCSFKYYIRNQGKEVQVCKLAFANIHGITFGKIHTLLEKLSQNILFPHDGRGRHGKRPQRITQESLVTVDKESVTPPELNISKLNTTNPLKLDVPVVVAVGNSDEKPRKPKRRERKPDQWKGEKRKRSILAGESHVSVKGLVVPPKKIGKDCECKLKCYEKVPEPTREILFKSFYSLKSHDEQNAYLFALIRKLDIKRKTNLKSNRRKCSYKYYIRHQGKEFQVCKLAYARIHGISFGKIRTLTEKLDQNILFPRDRRGKHDNQPKKIPQELLAHIKLHISNIMKSGHLRNYLKEDKDHVMTPHLNIAKLYTNYLQVNEPEAISCSTGQLVEGHIPKVKSWLYRKVFHEEVTPRDIQAIRKRFTAPGGARDGNVALSNNQGKSPVKKSRRKGIAKKHVETAPDTIHFHPKSVHHPILYNYSVPSSTESPVPHMSSLGSHKPVQHHAMYPQSHPLDEFSPGHVVGIYVGKDSRMPQMLGTFAHHHQGPTFEHRGEHVQETSSQYLDVNEMTNAFMYSSNC